MPPRAQPAPSRCSALAVTLTLFVRTINAMLEEFDADNNSHLDFGAWMVEPACLHGCDCASARVRTCLTDTTTAPKRTAASARERAQ